MADHWYPGDSRAQARVDEYLEWQHLNTRMYCAQYFLNRWMIPMMTKKFDQAKVNKSLKEMEACLATFEKVWLEEGKRPFVAGDR